MADFGIHKFRCTQCGAEDDIKFFANETVPLTLNCYACHAGEKMSVQDMARTGQGMVEVEVD